MDEAEDRYLMMLALKNTPVLILTEKIASNADADNDVYIVHINKCRFIFNCNSRVSLYIFTSFAPLKTQKNTPQSRVIYLLTCNGLIGKKGNRSTCIAP